MAASPPPIHPLDLGGMVTYSLRLLRHGWRPIYAATAIFLVPAYVLTGAFQAITWASLVDWQDAMLRWMTDLQYAVDLSPPPLGGIGTYLLASIALSLLMALLSALAYAAVVDVTGAIYRGEQATALASIRRTMGRLVSLAGAYLLIVAAIVGLLLVAVVAIVGLALVGNSLAVFMAVVVGVALVVAFVFLMVRWSLFVQPIMLEGTSALSALERSWRLISGSMWRVFGYILLFTIVIGLLAAVFSLVGGLIFGVPDFTFQMDLTDPSAALRDISPVGLFGQTLVGGLGAILLTPITVIAFTLLFYDLRWRREGPPSPPMLATEEQL